MFGHLSQGTLALSPPCATQNQLTPADTFPAPSPAPVLVPCPICLFSPLPSPYPCCPPLCSLPPLPSPILIPCPPPCPCLTFPVSRAEEDHDHVVLHHPRHHPGIQHREHLRLSPPPAALQVTGTGLGVAQGVPGTSQSQGAGSGLARVGFTPSVPRWPQWGGMEMATALGATSPS